MMDKDNSKGFLKKSNEALFSISTVIITLAINIFFKNVSLGFLIIFLLYLPATFILISFYYIIKHKVYKQEVSHDPNAYTYIEDSNIPRRDRIIIFISMTVCVWTVLTTGVFFKLFVR